MLLALIRQMVLPQIWLELPINMSLQVQLAMILRDGQELLHFHQLRLDSNVTKELHMASRTMFIK
jgi:hypothetical protein